MGSSKQTLHLLDTTTDLSSLRCNDFDTTSGEQSQLNNSPRPHQSVTLDTLYILYVRHHAKRRHPNIAEGGAALDVLPECSRLSTAEVGRANVRRSTGRRRQMRADTALLHRWWGTRWFQCVFRHPWEWYATTTTCFCTDSAWFVCVISAQQSPRGRVNK